MKKLNTIIENFFKNTGSGIYADIESILKELGVSNYTINNGKVDVLGDINISNFKGKTIGIQFGRVDGNLNVVNCDNLESLVGFPESVHSITINHCPKLKNLEYIPRVKYGVTIYNCHNVKSLKGIRAVDKYDIDLHLANLPGIKNMDGLGSNISSINLKLMQNLESLNGCPDVTYSFIMIDCPKVTNLVGMPTCIEGNLKIINCKGIISVVGISKEVGCKIDIELFNNFKWDGEMDKVCRRNRSKYNHMYIFTKSYSNPLLDIRDIIGSISDKRASILNIGIFDTL